MSSFSLPEGDRSFADTLFSHPGALVKDIDGSPAIHVLIIRSRDIPEILTEVLLKGILF
jgi:hypothetical protein